MKSSHISLALFTLFTSSSILSLHIVTVQTEKIMQESMRGQQLRESVMNEQKRLAAPFEKIEAEIKVREAEVLEMQKSLAKEEELLRSQAALLSPDARADKYEELQKKHRDAQEKSADLQRAMRKAHEDAQKVDQKLEAFYRKEMMAFEQEIKQIIAQTSPVEGWDLVLPKEMTMYASPATDKTEVIIQKLDAAPKKHAAHHGTHHATPEKTVTEKALDKLQK